MTEHEARKLDDTTRNPVRGYGIPITELGADTDWFYPDFLMWTDKAIWAFDPKGTHLTTEAVVRKLLDLSSIEGLEKLIRVALILSGSYDLNPQGLPQRKDKLGATIIWRTTTGTKHKTDPNPYKLIKELIENP